jgi:hypothetical protein
MLCACLFACRWGPHSHRCSSSSPWRHPQVQGPHPHQGMGQGRVLACTTWGPLHLEPAHLRPACMDHHQDTCRYED